MIHVIQRVACLFGHHRRSGGRAWNDGEAFHSWCKGCGKPMVRDQHGWHLDSVPPPAPDQD